MDSWSCLGLNQTIKLSRSLFSTLTGSGSVGSFTSPTEWDYIWVILRIEAGTFCMQNSGPYTKLYSLPWIHSFKYSVIFLLFWFSEVNIVLRKQKGSNSNLQFWENGVQCPIRLAVSRNTNTWVGGGCQELRCHKTLKILQAILKLPPAWLSCREPKFELMSVASGLQKWR